MNPPGDIPITIRGFRPEDLVACRMLYTDGLVVGGKLADNDTGFDMDDIHQSYMKSAGSNFWVAENQANEIVGMIGLAHHEEGTAEIRRLRVRLDSQRRGIGSKLLETALRFCQDNGYLKVTLDTFVDREPAMRLFEKFHFRHLRSRNMHDRELMYFYLDLYQGESQRHGPAGQA